MLREEYDPREGSYSNTLVFTVHYLIADDTSLLNLSRDFLDFLNTKHKNNSQDWDEKLLLNTPPLRPSLTEIIKGHLTLSRLEKVFLAIKSILARMLKRIMGKPRHQFAGVFQPTSLQDPSITKKTCILTNVLHKEAISMLVRNCKENRCSVHGTFIAATSIAMATMLQNGKIRIPTTIPVSFSVNVRQECTPLVMGNELGCFSLDCDLRIPVPASNKTDEPFCNLAKKCTEDSHQAVSKSNHHSTLKSLCTLSIDYV